MTDGTTREFVLGEEVEFVYNDETFIYSFRSRGDARITFKRVWNSSSHPIQEAEIDVYPNACLAAVNTAVLVLFKAATWKLGVPMPTFIPKTLGKLLASKGYISREVLERNLRGAIGTFNGTRTGGQKNSKRARIAEIGEVMEFLEPFTPWGVSVLPEKIQGN
jgi:hypothetical protein